MPPHRGERRARYDIRICAAALVMAENFGFARAKACAAPENFTHLPAFTVARAEKDANHGRSLFVFARRRRRFFAFKQPPFACCCCCHVQSYGTQFAFQYELFVFLLVRDILYSNFVFSFTFKFASHVAVDVCKLDARDVRRRGAFGRRRVAARC